MSGALLTAARVQGPWASPWSRVLCRKNCLQTISQVCPTAGALCPPASLTRGHNDFAPQAFLVAQLVENPPSMTDIWVRSLGWEDPLEKGKATHSSILAWRVPWTVYSPRGRRESDMTEQLSLV